MELDNLAAKIRNKALELGFVSCGIIKTDAVEDYADRLEERIKLFPESKPILENLFRFAHPQKTYDWAKSIIVCVYRYGKYKVPEGIDGLIGKYYLYEYKSWKYSKEYVNINLFESYLKEMGLKTARGVTAARWAAYKAGLGILRKNNFFYNKHGSWNALETWVIDHEMEYRETETITPCSKNCTKCVDACPTGALTQPYGINAANCINFLTWGVKDLAPEHLRDKMDKWLYGCDRCQDVCPMNKNKWKEEEEYPNLHELANYIGIEKMFEMDEKSFLNHIQPRFPLISKEKAWRWKCNAINAMANSFDAKYSECIKNACHDGNENVREIAAWACKKLGL